VGLVSRIFENGKENYLKIKTMYMRINVFSCMGIAVISMFVGSCTRSTSDTISTLPAALNKGVWIQRASIPTDNVNDSGRTRSVSFVIGNYGYVGLGTTNVQAGNHDLNDLWRYDPSTNSWSRMASLNVKNGARIGAVAFTIGNIAYVGTGFTDSSKSLLRDFYAYNAETNQWSQKASLPFALAYATAFSINGKGYIGTGGGDMNGTAPGGSLKEFYEYDPTNDTWTQISNNYPGTSRIGAMSFVYNNIAYVVGGSTIDLTTNAEPNSASYPKDFYSYDGNSWKQLKSIDNNIAREGVAFVINNTAYLTGGDGVTTNAQSTWSYNISNDQWQQVASFPRNNKLFKMIGFSINNKGYVGGGEQYWNNTLTSSTFYEFALESIQ
jgi:N-acetylneuraminic acid mutarotase